MHRLLSKLHVTNSRATVSGTQRKRVSFSHKGPRSKVPTSSSVPSLSCGAGLAAYEPRLSLPAQEERTRYANEAKGQKDLTNSSSVSSL